VKLGGWVTNDISVGGAFNNNGGVVTLAGNKYGGDTLSAGAFSNSGSVTVGRYDTLTVQNNYTQSGAGASTKVNGTLQATKTIINGGTLSGGGTISGDVENVGGTVTASDPGIPDILTINGNYTQGSGGILEAFLEGTTPGTGYSQLVVDGTATLGGTLDVELVPGSGLVITPGESFDLVNASGCGDADCVIGSFASVMGLPTLPSGDSWLLSFTGGSLDLTLTGSADYYAPAATPEPSALLLLVAGIAMMSILLKYRNPVRSAVA
jgi:hypothetical protein